MRQNKKILSAFSDLAHVYKHINPLNNDNFYWHKTITNKVRKKETI